MNPDDERIQSIAEYGPGECVDPRIDSLEEVETDSEPKPESDDASEEKQNRVSISASAHPAINLRNHMMNSIAHSKPRTRKGSKAESGAESISDPESKKTTSVNRQPSKSTNLQSIIQSDLKSEGYRLTVYERSMIRTERQSLSVLNSMKEHSVMKYVKSLPYERVDSYPAMMYLASAEVDTPRFTQEGGHAIRYYSEKERPIQEGRVQERADRETPLQEGAIRKDGNQRGTVRATPVQETVRNTAQVTTKDYVEQIRRLLEDGIECETASIDFDDNSDDDRRDHNDGIIHGETSIDVLDCSNSNQSSSHPIDSITIDPSHLPYRYISWEMPAHDMGRPSLKGCGFIRSSDGTLVFTSCSGDHEHHIKAKRRHCWSLRCPVCSNDTALKGGVSIEKQLLKYSSLSNKIGRPVGEVGHWTISPPQSAAKRLIQTEESYTVMVNRVTDSLQRHGSTGGVVVFHPWRQTSSEWTLSPHFHSINYGRIDTDSFRRENPGWIIKKIHSRERIKSIRHTAAYLLTHSGQGLVARNPEDVDWDLDILNHLIPGLKSEGADYREDDYVRKGDGRGRLIGDISDIDWIEWTKSRLKKEVRIRYFGGCAQRSFRSLGTSKRYRIRTCRECGALLRTYDGLTDEIGDYVRYIRIEQAFCFTEDYNRVISEFLRFKSTFAGGSHPDSVKSSADATAFAMASDLAISTEEYLPSNDDIEVSGPFDEPDSFFLNRQRRAFGEEIQAEA